MAFQHVSREFMGNRARQIAESYGCELTGWSIGEGYAGINIRVTFRGEIPGRGHGDWQIMCYLFGPLPQPHAGLVSPASHHLVDIVA